MAEDAPGLRLFHQVRRVSVEFEQVRTEFARLHGLHVTDLRALIALLDAGRAGHRATPGWLGGRLGLNSAGTTTLVDRLARLGYVERVRDTRDRRKVFVEVTPAAVDLGWSFFGPLIHATLDGMRSFTEAELATVDRFLDTVGGIIEAHQDRLPAPTPTSCGDCCGTIDAVVTDHGGPDRSGTKKRPAHHAN